MRTPLQMKACWHNFAIYILKGFIRNMEGFVNAIDPQHLQPETRQLLHRLNTTEITIRDSLDEIYLGVKEEMKYDSTHG